MLSRRNIRIKVLQSLYMLGRDPDLTAEEAMAYYRESLDRSQSLYLFNLLNLIRTTDFSTEDTERKHAKYLPSEDDKNFSNKLFSNTCIQALVDEEDLQLLFKKRALHDLLDEDTVRKYYKSFAKLPEYKTYVYHAQSPKEDREILLRLYKHLTKQELFEESMEDHFPTWEDDKSLIIGAMKKTIKALPDTPEMYRTFRPDYEACVEFGEALLDMVAKDDGKLEKVIGPALENWEVDRVANIDMLFLKMAICEFIHFVTIPTKGYPK